MPVRRTEQRGKPSCLLVGTRGTLIKKRGEERWRGVHVREGGGREDYAQKIKKFKHHFLRYHKLSSLTRKALELIKNH